MPARKQRPAPAPTAELERGGILTIDLAAIVANWRELARRAVPAQCAAVVKADGYGCGIEPITAALAKAGCSTFFVATLAEARQARAVAPQAAIYVLAMLPGTLAAFAQGNFRPVIGSIGEIAQWEAFRANGWQGTAALHIGTGMNRPGLRADELTPVGPRPPPRPAGLDVRN